MSFTLVANEGAKIKERDPENGKMPYLEYFGDSSRDDVGSEGFLVTILDRTIPAHFHDVDQFQILLGGLDSYYQRTQVTSVMVHYTDAYTTYGPLIGANPPLRFFTLRAAPTETVGFMPADRDMLLYRGNRHFFVDVEPFINATELEAGFEKTDTLIEATADGLAAYLLSAGPNVVMSIPSAQGSSGQHIFIVDGAAELEDESFSFLSLGWHSADDGPIDLKAGSSGCHLLVLQYPYPATPVARDMREAASSSAGSN